MFPNRRGPWPSTSSNARYLDTGPFPMPNYNNGNGFQFQHNSALPLMGMPTRPMWNMPPQRFQQQQFNQMNNNFHNNNNNYNGKGKRRQSSNTPQRPSKKAKSSQEKEKETLYKVPISKGTENITTSVWNYFLDSQMTDEDLRRKLLLRKCLHTILQGAFIGCRLFIVGSSMTGFATHTSDVDMCLMISEKQLDQKGDAAFILSRIALALRNVTFVQYMQVIKAKVPILKFTDMNTDIECDLNINNTIGIRNTHLLRHYAYLDWRVRPLMLFIKRWARFHDINDASKKTISSYSLSLMLIHYLQAGVTPPVLPCLQDIAPKTFDKKRDVREITLDMTDKVEFKSTNVATLGELLLGFLNYYTHIHNFSDIISVRTGKSLTCIDASRNYGIDCTGWKDTLRIEEPFERSNTARSVFDEFVMRRIARVIHASFTRLNATRDVESILSRPF